MAYNAISSMRQHIKPTDRVHGIITEGGVKPNIIPEKTSMQYYVRSRNKRELEQLKQKVLQCFEGAAVSTGCRLEYKWQDNPYYDILTNDILAELYTQNVASLGVKLPSKEEQLRIPAGSTDMGNVSYEVPSMHPLYAIPSKEGESNHSRGFTHCASTGLYFPIPA